MVNLFKFQAKICYVAGGVLIHDQKILLIKHKKMGLWLCPGGHLETNETPHQAAEREFFEETGIRVVAYDPFFHCQLADVQFVPSPIETELHWVSQENYQQRLKSNKKNQRVQGNLLWPRGCEQHLSFLYLVKAVSSLECHKNTLETDGIAWFTIDELDHLKTHASIKLLMKHSLAIQANYQDKVLYSY